MRTLLVMGAIGFIGGQVLPLLARERAAAQAFAHGRGRGALAAHRGRGRELDTER
jgi:uncharacterized protein YbjT (DUF2867 family)